ncbi:MAG: glycosyltransferase [Endomicrobium sp.]|jgi:glycosyltransferase involved in cell wall biosynthesis|nr:glycosyltransferase [Endomicrobium sp.]
MNIENTLEIILITYNRKNYLENTLKQILADKSPIKNCKITVLDNASTDGSGELIREYAKKHPNIKYIRHNRNIGGNANIARAFEEAALKYLWVLADDDDYNFHHWEEVETAIEKDYDLIVVNTEIIQGGEVSLSQLPRLLTFLPASIHKTDNLDSVTMTNIYDNIPNWFPHLAAVFKTINNNGKVYISQHNIITSGVNNNNKGISVNHIMNDLAPAQKNLFFEVAFLKSLEMIKDKKLRSAVVENFAPGYSFFKAILNTFKKNRIELNNYAGNLLAPWTVFNLSQKIRYLIALLCLDILFILKYPRYYRKRKLWKAELEKAIKNNPSNN